MKTKIILSAVLLLILGGLMACEDCLIDDPAVITKYTIDAFVVGTGGTITPSVEVVSGKNSTVNFKPDVGYDIDIVKIDGIATVLTNNLSYTFTNVISNHKIEVTYKKNMLGLLTQVTWKTARFQRWNALTMKPELDLYPPDIDVELYTYHSDYSLDLVNFNGVTEHWKFVLEDSMLMLVTINGGKGDNQKIVEISDTTLKLEFISRFASQSGPDPTKDAIIRITYDAVSK